MQRTLEDQFRATQGDPIAVGDQLVYMMYETEVEPLPAELQITFVRELKVRPQALRLKVHGARLEIGGELRSDVVLWAGTSPKTLTIALRPTASRGPASLRVWNAWADSLGAMQAWIGNSGIVVERALDGVVVLRCSDGVGVPRFDDLVVHLAIHR